MLCLRRNRASRLRTKMLTIAGKAIPMSPSTLTLGQFSRSPVIAAASYLGLWEKAGLELETTFVASSPGQFASLRDGEIDIAVTSPDNVLLYATTAKNPLETLVPVSMVRAIDRGLALTATTRPEVSTLADLKGRRVGVDVLRSGFALLLFAMLRRAGLEREDVEFVELGSTPKRADALIAGEIDATILNAESLVRAVQAGMIGQMSSADVSATYLGTVLAVRQNFELPSTFLDVWNDATTWVLTGPEDEVRQALTAENAALGTSEYLAIARDPRMGLLADPTIEVSDLETLAGIRRSFAAYAPEAQQLPGLIRQ